MQAVSPYLAPLRPAARTAQAGAPANPFFSADTAAVFGRKAAEISNFKSDITPEVLRDEIRRNAGEPTSFEIVSDGALRILRAVRQKGSDSCTVVLTVPGLGVIGTAEIDRASGAVSSASSHINPSLATRILLQSESAIAREILRKLSADSGEKPLSSYIQTVAEVFENEAVLAGPGGEAIIFSANPREPQAGARVIGFRPKIEAVQSGGLESCRILLGTGTTFGFALHATNPVMFKALGNAIGEQLHRDGKKPDGRLSVIWNYAMNFELGDPGDAPLYLRAAREIMNSHLGPGSSVREVNASSCCLHVPTGRTAAAPMRLFSE